MIAKRYFVSVKREKKDSLSPDWSNQLAGIAGVTVTGVMQGRAYIMTNEQGIARVRDQFGKNFYIEEEITRSTG